MVSLQMAHEISSQNAGIAPICNTSSLLDYIYCVNSYQHVILLFFIYPRIHRNLRRTTVLDFV